MRVGSNSNGYTQLQWAFEEEDQVANYKIDKAETLGLFTENVMVNANHQSDYSWQDSQPIHGYTFYRIKAVTLTGKIIYSPVIRIQDRMKVATATVVSQSGIQSAVSPFTVYRNGTRRVFGYAPRMQQGIWFWNKLFSSRPIKGVKMPLLPVPLPTGFYIITVNDQRKKIFTRKVLIR